MLEIHGWQGPWYWSRVENELTEILGAEIPMAPQFVLLGIPNDVEVTILKHTLCSLGLMIAKQDMAMEWGNQMCPPARRDGMDQCLTVEKTVYNSAHSQHTNISRAVRGGRLRETPHFPFIYTWHKQSDFPPISMQNYHNNCTHSCPVQTIRATVRENSITNVPSTKQEWPI